MIVEKEKEKKVKVGGKKKKKRKEGEKRNARICQGEGNREQAKVVSQFLQFPHQIRIGCGFQAPSIYTSVFLGKSDPT